MRTFEKSIEDKGASKKTIRVLVDCISTKGEIFERHFRFLRSMVTSLDIESAAFFIDRVDESADKSNREIVSRFSDVLVSLIRSVPSIEMKAQGVLSKWEAILPGVQARAFHARVG